MTSRYLPLALFLVLVVMAAAFGASFPAGDWYVELRKPYWTPPAWVFGPAWSVLYVLMALAMWRVWITGHYVRVGALIWWLIQLGLNAAWSWLFFGLNRIGWAMAEMALLVVFVILCIKAFSSISRLATWMMVPYLLWLLFAFALNVTIWDMNGGGAGLFYFD
ncbi:TspO/MBR family protein [Elongatibacter sediminis]|uniref:TspO/MBR family protein n=1 Tax=Elongatibacter sediminis TaxID=3119006 RepID=A0AAW9R5R3_9GAMM